MKKDELKEGIGNFFEGVGKAISIVPATAYGIGKIGQGLVKGKSFKEIDEDLEANETFDAIIETGGDWGRKHLGSVFTALGTAVIHDKIKEKSDNKKS